VTSHPRTLLRTVEANLRPIGRGRALAVAVSGGPDSMALLHCLSILRERLDFRLLAISIDHGLRPEAPEEVDLVRRFAEELGVPFRSARLSLPSGSNIQARAREARYEALHCIADEELGPEAFLATAHHAEDRAETVLLRLLRGTSVEGLGVLPPVAGRLLRPMVTAQKSEVLCHNERHRVPSVSDPSNQDPRFLRVRVRRELLPLLEELGPGIVQKLCSLAEDASGEIPLGLNREQRAQLRRALSDPKARTDVPLGRGLWLRKEST
jgi:tRNA(Ile)-lysidine synthase